MKEFRICRYTASQSSLPNRIIPIAPVVALLAAGLLAWSPAELRAQSEVAPPMEDSTVVRIAAKLQFNEEDRGQHLLDNTETFTYRGAPRNVVVPEGAYEAQFRVVGGQGGKSMAENGVGYWFKGGDGAQVTGRIAVTPEQILTLFVGQYGGDSNYNMTPGDGGWGMTGPGGRGGGGQNRDGGGGGGASGISIRGQTVLIAGAGGGAGGLGFIGPANDPGAGGSSGKTADTGVNGKGPGAGKGGAGAANGGGPGGAGGNGSHVGGGGGGGGAGYVGGKGGSGGGFGGGGGGGGGAGSSFMAPSVQGSSISRATTSDGNGIIYITWSAGAVPQCSDQTIHVPRNSPGVSVQLRCNFATSFRLVSLPDHGFVDNRNLYAGTMTYVPLEGFSGLDSITFVGVDTSLSAPAIITFDVN